MKSLRILAALVAACLLAPAAFAGTPTTNYSWTKPAVGADADLWGTYINTDLDGIDSTVFAVSGVANAACPKAGCTFTGATTFSAVNPVITGLSGSTRQITFSTSGVPRWQFIGANSTAETGSNAGSDYGVTRLNDAGSVIDSPLVITRSTGMATFADGLTVVGTITGSLTGNVTGNLTGAVTGNASTATKFATARTLAITGDLAWTSPSFDGSGNVTAAGTLATVNSNVGSCGDATHVAQVTLNAKGLATACSAVAITGSPIKAWANFVGSTGSPNKVLNVNSVGHTATGKYPILFTSSMADNSYAVFFGLAGTVGSNNNTVCSVDATTKSTAGFSIVCQVGNGTQGSGFVDPPEVYFQVID